MNNYVEQRKQEKISPRLFPTCRGKENSKPSFTLMMPDDLNALTASPGVGTGVFEWSTEVTPARENLSPAGVGEEWRDPMFMSPQNALSMNFNDPFSSTVMPLDPKATFYLYHCKFALLGQI